MTLIRKCSPADAKLLAEIAARTFEETYAGQVPAGDMARYLRSEFAFDRVRRELQRDGTIYYLAARNGGTAGYLKLNLPGAQTDLEETDALEIESLYVSEAHRGTGIGRRLMEQAVTVARQAGLTALWLGVWDSNANAIAFYEHWGFRRFGSHPFEVGRTRHTDILMKLEMVQPAFLATSHGRASAPRRRDTDGIRRRPAS